MRSKFGATPEEGRDTALGPLAFLNLKLSESSDFNSDLY
jgi:hypothetical protein